MKYYFLDVNDEPREILNKSIIHVLDRQKLEVGKEYIIPANKHENPEIRISNEMKLKCISIDEVPVLKIM